jgi:hypothetical protein
MQLHWDTAQHGMQIPLQHATLMGDDTVWNIDLFGHGTLLRNYTAWNVDPFRTCNFIGRLHSMEYSPL